MVTVEYRNLNTETAEDAWSLCTVDDLLLRIPSLAMIMRSGKVFPPLAVMNDLLSAGSIDEGMSGGVEWKALDVDEEQHDELLLSLQAKLGIDFLREPDLERQTSFASWSSRAVGVVAKRKRSSET